MRSRSASGVRSRLEATGTRALPLIAAAVAVLFGVLLLDFTRRSVSSAREAERYYDASEELSLVLLHLRDVEATQRGYVLTGDDSYVQDYEAAVEATRLQLARLAGLTRTAAETQTFGRLEELVTRRLDLSAEVLEVRRTRGLRVAADLVAEGTGRDAMNSVEQLVARMQEAMEVVRTERNAALERRANLLLWLIVAGTVTSAGTSFGASAVLGRVARRRAEDAAQLAEQNEQLADQATELEAQAAELEVQAAELEEAAVAAGEREGWFRAILEHAGDAIIVADARGRIAYASPSVGAILGLEPGALPASALPDLVYPADRRAALRLVARARRQPATAIAGELRFTHLGGSPRALAGHLTNLLDDPAVGGWVVNAHDVTAERQTAEQLRQAQKMEAVGRLAGGIAHDFNNMLTTMRGFTQFAQDSLPADHDARRDLDEVLTAADAAAALTRQLLAFSRQQVLRPEIVDLNELIGASANMLRRLIGSDVELVVRPGPGLARVRVDRSQVLQVIMNLAVNARDAMPRGGRLTIDTRNITLTEEYAERRHDVQPGRYVVISVSDTGEGIPPEIRDRIFEPFFTTKEQGKGTGLGLSTSYGIVNQLGGRIWLYSEPGHGTTFKIYLPATAARATVAAEVRTGADAADGRGRTIMIVEDDPGVRNFARRALERQGWEVIACGSGGEALTALEVEAPRIAVVLTDVIMPGMGGAELARRVAALYPSIRVIHTSGYPAGEIGTRGDLAPDVEFLEKPYTSADLVRRIAAAAR